jgi:hypothetical protein
MQHSQRLLRQPRADAAGMEQTAIGRVIPSSNEPSRVREPSTAVPPTVVATYTFVNPVIAVERIGRPAYVGSDVVDTIVLPLRKKLDPGRDRIQRVPRAGYRYIGLRHVR